MSARSARRRPHGATQLSHTPRSARAGGLFPYDAARTVPRLAGGSYGVSSIPFKQPSTGLFPQDLDAGGRRHRPQPPPKRAAAAADQMGAGPQMPPELGFKSTQELTLDIMVPIFKDLELQVEAANSKEAEVRVGDPASWAIIRHDGPGHLGL